MRQLELPIQRKPLFEEVISVAQLRSAFEAVRKNHGASGVDGVRVEDFERNLDPEVTQLHQELESWTYKPKPVRRVEIPKPNGKGVRMLGVPCVRDRVVQAAIKQVLEPILDPEFSQSSYGFRPERNQEQAVKEAQRIVKTGKRHVVDIDLSKFFDRINHDRLMYRLRAKIEDKRILRLIGLTLKSGIMKEGLVEPTKEGSVQGSPMSPLLSNVVLDELDKELERRGLEFCRFADDCNIFTGSQKAAERVMRSITKFIERKLKLVVNQEKSKVAEARKVKFLGMTIVGTAIAISHKSMGRAMEKVHELTKRGTSITLEKTMEKINQWYRGWASYHQMTQFPYQLELIECHLRRRLRARLVSQQKRRRHLYNKLVKQGVSRRSARIAYTNRKRWALSHTIPVEKAWPNRWFIHLMGMIIVSDKQLPHWFSLGARPKLV